MWKRQLSIKEGNKNWKLPKRYKVLQYPFKYTCSSFRNTLIEKPGHRSSKRYNPMKIKLLPCNRLPATFQSWKLRIESVIYGIFHRSWKHISPLLYSGDLVTSASRSFGKTPVIAFHSRTIFESRAHRQKKLLYSLFDLTAW